MCENEATSRSLYRSAFSLLTIALGTLALIPNARCGEISQSALERAKARVHAAVESGEVAGAAHLVFHEGRVVHFDAVGVCDIADGRPFKRDTLLRIYSMTKPITSVAAMKLHEQGKFELDDPVSKFIPAFRHTTAMVKTDDGFETVAAKREITVRDVFRHTTGFGYGGGKKPGLEAKYRESRMVYRPPAGMLPPDLTIEEAANALARIPAHHHPGDAFTYGFSTDLLGRLIEVWSGQSLDDYLQAAVLGPLEMTDTGFSVPEQEQHRFASCHTWRENRLMVLDDSKTSPFNDGFKFLSGGGGLVSTIEDYAKFCEMLVGGGQRNGKRILQSSTLEKMFTDQLTEVAGDFRFGLGFSIVDRNLGTGNSARSVKQYAWGGYASTDFHVIPDENLFQVFVRQRIPTRPKLAREVFSIVYEGFTETSTDSDPFWPGWLGPERNGHVASVEPPKPWPEKLTLGWETQVGTGYATPLVNGNRLYQHARQGEDEVLLCLDLQTGSEIWRQKYSVPFKMGGGGEAHGKGPKSNPMLAGGRIFTLSITGVLSAWNAESGEFLWRRDSSQFGKTNPYWGATTSPIATTDRVYVHLGNDESGKLFALDAATGEESWTHGSDGASYSSPLIATIGGVEQVVEWNHRAVVGVRASDGATLWEFPFPHVGTNQNMPTPSIAQGRVYVGGENRGIYGLAPRNGEEGWTVDVVWHQEDVALDMSSAVVKDGLLFGFSHYDSGRLFCADTESGEIQWKGKPRLGQNVTFLTVGSYVLALVNNGRLQVYASRSEKEDPVVTYTVAESPTWAAPVLLPSGVLVKAEKTLRYWSFTGPNE